MRRLLLTGGDGALAGHLAGVARQDGWVVHAPGRAALDVTDAAGVRDAVAALRPDLVVHAAALADVDRCEREPVLAAEVNADGSGHVARACAAAGVRLVAVSTDLVFGGGPEPVDAAGRRRGHRSDDPTSPLQVYGRTKAAGEEQVLAAHDDAVVARVSVVATPGGGFVARIAQRARAGVPLRVVTDQVAAPTFAQDLSPALLELADSGLTGVVHRCGRGHVDRHGLAVAVLDGLGLDVAVGRLRTEELYPDIAPRPGWSVLDQAREHALGLRPLPHWRDALDRHLAGVVGEPTPGAGV